MDKEKLLVCNCSSKEHQLVFSKFDDEDQVYITVHLSKVSFWKRLRYLFGRKCKYGAFEEVITSVDKLQDIVNGLR